MLSFQLGPGMASWIGWHLNRDQKWVRASITQLPEGTTAWAVKTAHAKVLRQEEQKGKAGWSRTCEGINGRLYSGP